MKQSNLTHKSLTTASLRGSAQHNETIHNLKLHQRFHCRIPPLRHCEKSFSFSWQSTHCTKLRIPLLAFWLFGFQIATIPLTQNLAMTKSHPPCHCKAAHSTHNLAQRKLYNRILKARFHIIDCFVALLLAMTQWLRFCHCETSQKSWQSRKQKKSQMLAMESLQRDSTFQIASSLTLFVPRNDGLVAFLR